MSSPQVNVLVDVKHALGHPAGDALVDALSHLHGVSRAWISPRTSRLVLVDFDARQTDTQHILHAVVQRGFDACLVGM